MLIAALILGLVQVQEPTNKQRLVRQALETTGVIEALDQLPATVDYLAAVVAAQDPAPPEVIERLQIILKGALNQFEVTPVVERTVSSEVSEEFLAEVLRGVNTPLARRIQDMEITHANISDQELQEYLRGAITNPPSSARLEAIRLIDLATQTSAMQAETATVILLGLINGIAAAQPERQLTPLDPENERRSTTAEMENLVKITALFAYRSLTDEELQEYATLLGSDAVKTFYSAVKNAMVEAYGTAAADIARQIDVTRVR